MERAEQNNTGPGELGFVSFVAQRGGDQIQPAGEACVCTDTCQCVCDCVCDCDCVIVPHEKEVSLRE